MGTISTSVDFIHVHWPLKVLLALSFWFIGLAVYRLYFHPLAKIPGPRVAALTTFWEFYQDYFCGESGSLFLELDELHKKYGPIVRIKPNEVHVKDSNWMEVLYTGASDPRDKDPLVGVAVGVPLATIGTAPFELHRIRKASIAPFFSTRSVAALEPKIRKHATRLFEDLEARSDRIIDLRSYYYAWTTDFITDILFHESKGLFGNPDRADAWYKIIWDFAAQFPLTRQMPWLVTTGLELPLIVSQIFCPMLVPWISTYKDLLDKANKAVAQYNQQTSKLYPINNDEQLPKDIWDTILSSNLSPADKTPKRLANEIFNLLIAGSITTSKTAAIATFHILNNPEVKAKLKSELLQAIPNKDDMPSVKILQKLPVLSSIINETMRIGDVVATRIPMVSRHKDLVYGGNRLPAGCSISMTFCKAASDPQIFADPGSFRPERWLDGSQGPYDYERYVLPFGRGSRVCIGQHLSYAQLYFCLAGIFRRVDLELYDTIRERDIDVKGGGPLGEPLRITKGVRIKVQGKTPE